MSFHKDSRYAEKLLLKSWYNSHGKKDPAAWAGGLVRIETRKRNGRKWPASMLGRRQRSSSLASQIQQDCPTISRHLQYQTRDATYSSSTPQLLPTETPLKNKNCGTRIIFLKILPVLTKHHRHHVFPSSPAGRRPEKNQRLNRRGLCAVKRHYCSFPTSPGSLTHMTSPATAADAICSVCMPVHLPIHIPIYKKNCGTGIIFFQTRVFIKIRQHFNRGSH